MNDLPAVPDVKEEEWRALEYPLVENPALNGSVRHGNEFIIEQLPIRIALFVAHKHNASIQRVLEKASTLSDNVKAQPDQRKVGQDELLGVVKAAYLKHHCGLDNVGWDALGDMMQNALCNVMGDVEFQRWLAEDHNVD